METYTLRITVQGENSELPVLPVDFSAANDDEAIKLGTTKLATSVPANYALVKARICRGEEVIWVYFV